MLHNGLLEANFSFHGPCQVLPCWVGLQHLENFSGGGAWPMMCFEVLQDLYLVQALFFLARFLCILGFLKKALLCPDGVLLHVDVFFSAGVQSVLQRTSAAP